MTEKRDSENLYQMKNLVVAYVSSDSYILVLVCQNYSDSKRVLNLFQKQVLPKSNKHIE